VCIEIRTGIVSNGEIEVKGGIGLAIEEDSEMNGSEVYEISYSIVPDH
jgi:hypothetical protein